ncbi:MAG: hypothetical protein CK425_03250 [Parachlamydia sp.]|nr:MAG: hypothetical protein CK425_03250 [Parachlamydia sp.]
MDDFIFNIDQLLHQNEFNTLLESKNLTQIRLGKNGELSNKKTWGNRPKAQDKAEINARIKNITLASISLIQQLDQIKSELHAEGKAPTEENLIAKGFTKKQVQQIQEFEVKTRTLFLKKLKPLIQQKAEFRDLLNNQVVQGHLNAKLKKLREEKQKGIPVEKQRKHKLKRQIEKAKLTAEFGLLKSTSRGKTGAHFVEWVSKKSSAETYTKIGIFKVSNKDTDWNVRLKNMMKRLFFGQLFYLNKKKLAQSKAEVAAYQVSRFLGFSITPESRVVTLGGKIGTMQLYLNGYHEAAKFTHLFGKKDNFSEQGWRQFQEMTLFDYLIGNLDRHNENLLIKFDAAGKIHEIKAIDNANSFPEKNFNRFIKIASRNQYKWRRFQVAKEEFDPTLRAQMHFNTSPQKMDELVSSLHDKLPGFLSPKMEKLLRQRAEVLYALSQNEKLSPHTLAKFRTGQAIKGFLGH